MHSKRHQKYNNMRSRTGTRRRLRNSAENQQIWPPRMWVWYNRCHTKHNIQGQGKSHKSDSKSHPKLSQHFSQPNTNPSTLSMCLDPSSGGGLPPPYPPPLDPLVDPRAKSSNPDFQPSYPDPLLDPGPQKPRTPRGGVPVGVTLGVLLEIFEP